MTTSAPPRRFTRATPCPVCGGSDDAPRGQKVRCFGFLSNDGQWAHCSREEHAGECKYVPRSLTWCHRIGGKCRCGTEHAPAEPSKARGRSTLGKIESIYDYTDATDRVVYQTVRYTPKDFRQRRFDPSNPDKFIWNLKGVELVPYRLPQLLAADQGEPVFYVEGEKDADRLASFGLVATTTPMGRGKWRDHYAVHFAGRDVLIIPDVDPDGGGMKHALDVARSLYPVARSVKILELSGPHNKDVSVWLDHGNSIAGLKRLADEAPTWTPTPKAEVNGKHTSNGHGSIVVPPKAASAESPRRRPLTDLGNAERFVDRHAQNVRHVHPWGKSLVWDGRRWTVDNTAAMKRMAKATIRSIYAEAAGAKDDAEREAIGKWATASENNKGVNAMLALAVAEEGIPVLPDQLDRHPWLLNCLNGTVDLRTGLLAPHRREDLITSLAPVAFDPKAECPIWTKTLGEIFGQRADVITFWQRLCGLSLTGDVCEQILPIAWGSGANGKSTILGAMLGVLGGDYAMKAVPEFLLAMRGEHHATERADLFGKRLVVAIETGEGARINETLVKELTGSDRIRARRMREDFWEFSPTHKIMLCTNHKPVVKGTDHAIWRRLRLIPFDVKFADDKQDRKLPEKFVRERAGILAWCVRGCLDWQREGLTAPDDVTKATAQYRADQDTLAEFLAEHCVTLPGTKAKAGALWARFQDWAQKAGEDPGSQKRFGAALSERGFERYTDDGTWYRGIGLKQGPSDDRDRAY